MWKHSIDRFKDMQLCDWQSRNLWVKNVFMDLFYCFMCSYCIQVDRRLSLNDAADRWLLWLSLPLARPLCLVTFRRVVARNVIVGGRGLWLKWKSCGIRKCLGKPRLRPLMRWRCCILVVSQHAERIICKWGVRAEFRNALVALRDTVCD